MPWQELANSIGADCRSKYGSVPDSLMMVLQCVHDLEHAAPRVRAQARYDVQQGMDLWLDLLDLGPEQRRRVEALLAELAR